jgi:hypothetical protein
MKDVERYCCLNTVALIKSTHLHDEEAPMCALQPMMLSAIRAQVVVLL